MLRRAAANHGAGEHDACHVGGPSDALRSRVDRVAVAGVETEVASQRTLVYSNTDGHEVEIRFSGMLGEGELALVRHP